MDIARCVILTTSKSHRGLHGIVDAQSRCCPFLTTTLNANCDRHVTLVTAAQRLLGALLAPR